MHSHALRQASEVKGDFTYFALMSTGTYISNRASDKITALTDQAWLLRSGSAADTQLVSDYGAASLVLCLERQGGSNVCS